MKDLLDFASSSPILTFFIVMLIGQTLVGVAEAIARIFK